MQAIDAHGLVFGRARGRAWLALGCLCAAFVPLRASAHAVGDHLVFNQSETAAVSGNFGSLATISDDGAQLYVAGQPGAVFVLARDALTGGLSFQSQNGLSGPPGGAAPFDMELSDNGTELYVALQASDSVAFFSRDPITGNLGFLASAGAFTNLNNPFGVDISPDDQFIYVNSGFESGLAIFRYDAMTDVVNFSQFQQLADIFNNLTNVHYVEGSPGGENLYLSWRNNGNARFLWTTTRDAVNGSVTVTQTIDSVPGGPTPFFPNRVFASPDGAHVYVSLLPQGLAVFSRDALTGQLSFASLATLPTLAGNTAPQALVFDATGEHLYASVSAGVGVVALLTLHRDLVTGAVTVVDEDVLDPQDAAGRPVLSPDGAHLYVAQAALPSVEIYDVPEATPPLLGLAALMVLVGFRRARIEAGA